MIDEKKIAEMINERISAELADVFTNNIAMLAAVNSLAFAMREAPGFDKQRAIEMIDLYLEKPRCPEEIDVDLYNRTLNNVRFHLTHSNS